MVKKSLSAQKETKKKKISKSAAIKVKKSAKQNLVIVESPAKAKTLKKYLGTGFEVMASYGHVRDLIPKEGAVDPQDNFAMKYEFIEKNLKHINAIADALADAETLYLATDPDREGEAIAWHIYEIMKEKKLLDDHKPVLRIVFHEITKSAIQNAVAHPRSILMDLVNAQQTRRALDFLVGFVLSPLLWKKVRPGLSAGRVQSPALRLIVEREEEIEKFEAQEYWTIEAENEHLDQKFTARLIEYNDEKIEQFTVTNETQAKSIEQDLIQKAKGVLVVAHVDKKQRKRNPPPPFITSTLQQEAARKLGFSASKTMRTAQQLYEGITTSEGSVGLITYMRTDSVTLSSQAIHEIRDFINQRYGKNNVPDEPRIYHTKSKNAQEAHEAVRPTSVFRTPEELHKYLSPEQYKLYDLIWKRTVASQMIHATIDTVSVDLLCGDKDRFRANGSNIAIPGFILLYQEGLDDAKKDETDERMLPHLEEGDRIKVLSIQGFQHFTEPPPRYSEASLIKALEEFGIGRPSTYASIISTIQNRKYALLENKRFKPTDVGRIVNKFLTLYFTQYVDYDFTARLEDELDEISRGEKPWIPVLDEFWQPFKHRVDDVETTVQRKDVTQESIDEKCPKCGKELSIRLGRRGRFVGCTGYPECDYTRNLEGETTAPEILEDRKCPDCGSALVIKAGRYGKFIGCSNYPNCKHMEPLEKPADTGIVCPECKQGSILKRKSRYGKIFFSCSRYPDCKYAIWNEPIAESCPKCNWPILTIKVTKRRGTEKVCPQKECGFSIPF